MPTIPEDFATAIRHHQAGRLQAAEEIYRQILRTEPDHADALHNLGLIAHQTGNHKAADKYELLARVSLGERSYATPAVADGLMYLRTMSHLFSLGGKASGGAENPK